MLAVSGTEPGLVVAQSTAAGALLTFGRDPAITAQTSRAEE